MNPGLAYVAVAWQLAGEVIVPLNREGGSGTGFRAQLLFFLDDLIPKLFDKPLLSDKPERDQLSWKWPKRVPAARCMKKPQPWRPGLRSGFTERSAPSPYSGSPERRA